MVRRCGASGWVHAATGALVGAALVAIVAGCGDDGGGDDGGAATGGGAGPSGAGGDGAGGGGAAIEGAAIAIVLNAAPDDVTVEVDGPSSSAVVAGHGRVETTLGVHLRACGEGDGLCARWDFGTVAGASEVEAVDGDVIAVLGPQSAEIVRSTLAVPEPGHAVVASLASPLSPQVDGVYGYVGADGEFVAFDLGLGPAGGQQVPEVAVIAFRHLDGSVLAFGGAFEEGAVYAGMHLHGRIEGEVAFHLCPLEADRACSPYVIMPGS